MSVVVINALDVPEDGGPEIERRFAAPKHAVDGAEGVEGFQLLRPVAGESRYFVVTQWASREAFEAWRDASARVAHSDGDGGPAARKPVATGSTLLEFEVVDL
ncbi:Heme-degrading monooxygenase HmoA [Quadrisphaera granulorum]|uniref:Heme-degrading monooxygenase HmoA n=1 Tax=Quadrisphaera granulorum TaxID=317664 RepID=A0A315ZSC9_9ACTN|nr:antibiotic biosynthesis monooxygenase [Quadrisphaera granulorum]PWJ48465.1 heme-degrading monooxygenase HmoA [Quadrisphaera granulorum]SZE98424.1 Heme-degrading monooxygenase HmoA [Quadrisphaera granulorum]